MSTTTAISDNLSNRRTSLLHCHIPPQIHHTPSTTTSYSPRFPQLTGSTFTSTSTSSSTPSSSPSRSLGPVHFCLEHALGATSNCVVRRHALRFIARIFLLLAHEQDSDSQTARTTCRLQTVWAKAAKAKARPRK
eukprot:2329725-Amphidinium_carterae.1